MRRTAPLIALAAMLALAACSGNAGPSSGVTDTSLPSASAQTASAPPSAGSAPPSTSASAAPSASSAPSAVPSDSPTPPPTPSPTPTPTPIAVCTSTMLSAKVTGWQGAMGSEIATVRLVNTSASACRLRGTPRLQLVDARGHILIDSKSEGASGLPHVAAGDKTWTLGHNGWVTTMVRASNYCGSVAPVLPTTVAFYLPLDTGRLVATASADGSAPPCFGNPGDPGSIAMNGWTQ